MKVLIKCYDSNSYIQNSVISKVRPDTGVNWKEILGGGISFLGMVTVKNLSDKNHNLLHDVFEPPSLKKCVSS